MTPRVRAEWGRRVAAEYRSAALAAAILRGGIAAGWPDALLRTALRVVGDELDHAALSHACVASLGGAEDPVPLDAATLWSSGEPDLLGDLVDRVARDLCLGETLAVPLFAAMRERTTHPEARAALTRILADEAVHRQFGWDALDALLAIDADAVRRRLQASVAGLVARFRDAYAPTDGSDPPLTEDERSAGLLALHEYGAVFAQVLRDDLRPRFARRGIAIE